MARNTSPITKQSRRDGYALHPKAHKLLVKRATPPGQHGSGRRPQKQSQYGIQLREKQKAKRLYGLLERQFRKLVTEAMKQPGQSGETLLRFLEQRLDNVVYRAGFARSRQAARQIVSHRHVTLNGRRVNIASIRVKPGDHIEIHDKSRQNEYFKQLDEIVGQAEAAPLSWLKSDPKKFTITVTGVPQREDSPQEINEQLIVEYYAR